MKHVLKNVLKFIKNTSKTSSKTNTNYERRFRVSPLHSFLLHNEELKHYIGLITLIDLIV